MSDVTCLLAMFAGSREEHHAVSSLYNNNALIRDYDVETHRCRARVCIVYMPLSRPRLGTFFFCEAEN